MISPLPRLSLGDLCISVGSKEHVERETFENTEKGVKIKNTAVGLMLERREVSFF